MKTGYIVEVFPHHKNHIPIYVDGNLSAKEEPYITELNNPDLVMNELNEQYPNLVFKFVEVKDNHGTL